MQPSCSTSLACLALELLVLCPGWDRLRSLTNVHTFFVEVASLISSSFACRVTTVAEPRKSRICGTSWKNDYFTIYLTKEMHVNNKNKWQNIEIRTTATFLIEPLLGKAVCVEECWGKFSTLTSNLEQRLPCTAFANFMHSRAHWMWAAPSPLHSLLRTVIECKGCQECTKKRRLTSYLTCKDRRVRNPQQKDIKQP